MKSAYTESTAEVRAADISLETIPRLKPYGCNAHNRTIGRCAQTRQHVRGNRTSSTPAGVCELRRQPSTPPDAPETTHNEAVIRLAGYLFDVPAAGRGAAYANAFRNSGAASSLLPYRVHHVGSVEEAAVEEVIAGAIVSAPSGNPVTNLSIVGSTLIVTYADGTTNNLPLPATGGQATMPLSGLRKATLA